MMENKRPFLLLILFVCFSGLAVAQAFPDTLQENRKPIKTYFFKNNLSVRNAALQTRYAFNKTPVKINDSVFFFSLMTYSIAVFLIVSAYQ